jgi:hypothetical protein
MNVPMLGHHHVVDGVSIAHFGQLPDDFVAPTAEAFRDNSAVEYGWEWWGNSMRHYVSGRPADHMPPSRRVETFGVVDIEGDQVLGPERLVGDPDHYGYQPKRPIDGRDELLEALSTPEPLVVPHAYQFGCFGQNTGYVDHHYVALALVPAARQYYRGWSYGSGHYDTYRYIPSDSIEEAHPTVKNGKWRRFGFALLPEPGFVPEDPGLYKC